MISRANLYRQYLRRRQYGSQDVSAIAAFARQLASVYGWDSGRAGAYVADALREGRAHEAALQARAARESPTPPRRARPTKARKAH